ncbi:MAG: hypothetical protein QHH07_09220 [Sedimentisphaerales bacterium]|nr:hypothetical protein [Sedimentisphaerales bacterium]
MTNGPDHEVLLRAQVHRWKMAFFGLVTLLAGVVLGAAGTLIWQARSRTSGIGVASPAGPGPADIVVQRLRSALHLSDAQVKAIRPILREHISNINRIRQEVRPKVAEELRQMAQRVAAHLDNRQRQLWNRQFRRLLEQLQWQWPAERARIQMQRGPIPERKGPNQGPNQPPGLQGPDLP